MFYSETFWVIFAIFFWVLVALLVVTFIADTYVKLMYYKWDKETRREELIRNKVGEIVDEKINPGGGFLEEQN